MKVIDSVVGVGLIASMCALTACQSSGVRAVGKASEENAKSLEMIKSLQGEWQLVKMNGENPPEPGVSTFNVTSMNSSVREVMFPGSAHEMTNMYHMNGGELMVTHYCGAGNQPRMRSVAVSPGHVEFKTESVTNLDTMDTEFMGELTLDMADKDTLKQTWRSIKSGKSTSHMIFEFRRK